MLIIGFEYMICHPCLVWTYININAYKVYVYIYMHDLLVIYQSSVGLLSLLHPVKRYSKSKSTNHYRSGYNQPLKVGSDMAAHELAKIQP